MIVTAYTDASHCPTTKVAACGWMLRCGDKTIKHSVVQMSGVLTAGDAEMCAVIKGMQDAFMVQGVSHIVVFTDYAINEYAREFTKPSHYRKFYFLNEYKETIQMIEEEGIVLQIRYAPRNNNPLSTKVDITCRKYLRELTKKQRA